MSYHIQTFKGLPGHKFDEFMETYFTTVIPSEKFLSKLPAPLSILRESVKIKPCFEFKEICEPFMDAILNFEIQSDDVFVCSLPKCGSSWMQTIVWLLTHGLNYEAIQNLNRSERMGDFDELENVKAAKEIASKLIANDKSLNEKAALEIGWKQVFRKLEAPRVIKTHYPAYFIPKGIWSLGARVIYVVRNPKDMAVSVFYFMVNYFHADVTIDDVVNGITNDKCCCSPNIDHVLDFWRIRHLPNVLFVAYEDAVADSFATIKQISEFLQCDYSEDQLKELTEYISFKSMKKIESINREADVGEMERKHGKKRPDSDFTFLRRGKPGGYRDDLNEDQIKKLDCWIEEGLEGSDFKFTM